MATSNDTMAEPQGTPDLFVAFANTISFDHGEATDAVPDVESLLAWLRDAGLISDRARAAESQRLARDTAAAERPLERFRYLRDLLRRIVDRMSSGEHPSRQQLRELNHVLRHGLHYHQLQVDTEGTRYSVAQVGDRLDQARAAIASSLASYLADEDPERLRVCANPGCQWVFVDRSPTGRRRWCDMRTCGNQAKVARHRARQRAERVGAEA